MNTSLKDKFKELEGQFDVEMPDLGHFDRFQAKLEGESKPQVKRNFWKPLAIAASLMLLVSLSGPLFSSNTTDLKDVSTEMGETQAYFTSVLNQELKSLTALETSENEQIIGDALAQMKKLEVDYKKLTIQLKESNEDKRIVYAMIDNYQKRIDILKSVINQINNINDSKFNSNENNFI